MATLRKVSKKGITPTVRRQQKERRARIYRFDPETVQKILNTVVSWKDVVGELRKLASPPPPLLPGFRFAVSAPTTDGFQENTVFYSGTPELQRLEEAAFGQKKLEEQKAALQEDVAFLEEQRAENERVRKLREAAENRAVRHANPYYSGANVGIFIGDQWVADAVSIEFQETVNKSPIYGYFSTHFDAVAKGNVIVQGQLAICYTGADYLGKILREFKRKEGKAIPDKTVAINAIEDAKRKFWVGRRVRDLEEGLVPLEYGYRGGFTGQVGQGFNIRIFFGAGEFIRREKEVQPVGIIETVNNVHLTSRGVITQSTGAPIAEVYSFFARSVSTKKGSILRLVKETDPETIDEINTESGR